jgi:hypothetical protein
MQQTTLPHRVARSAKDLTSATLSGSTFELKDPRESKYAGTSSQASTSFEHLSSGSAQPRPDINARGTSFRNETDDAHRRKAEQDFERFQQLDDFQAGFTACLASLNDAFEPKEDSYDHKDASLTGSNSQSKDVVKDAGTITIDAGESTSKHELASESISERDSDFARSAAVRRLNQIGAHLQRNLAMQTLEQETYIQSQALMNETRSIVMEEVTRQADDEARDTSHSNKAAASNRGVHTSAASHHRGAVARAESPPKPSLEKEDDLLQRQFHCPYYACHRNLRFHSTSSSSSSQRPCVHVGCDFTTETSSSWAEHIHTPHHDLLGSIEVSCD